MAKQTIPSNARIYLIKDCGSSIRPPRNVTPILKDLEEDARKLHLFLQQGNNALKSLQGRLFALREIMKRGGL